VTTHSGNVPKLHFVLDPRFRRKYDHENMTISSWDLGSCALSSGLGWDLLKGVAADHTSRTSLLKSLGKLSN